MSPSEGFWGDLIVALEESNVVPIIGSAACDIEGEESDVASWLAPRLAERLGLMLEDGDATRSLNEVACTYLLQGGTRQTLYTRAKQALAEGDLRPGPALRNLASIEPLNLFVTTSFDPLLEIALNDARHDGDPLTRVVSFSPEAREKDLPDGKEHLPTTLFYAFGKLSNQPRWALSEEDALEYVLALHRHLPMLGNLSTTFRENHLLLIGSRFSDWLVRFFLRIVKQHRLSEAHDYMHVVAEPTPTVNDALVMFFDSLRQDVRVFACEPRDFLLELSRRWRAHRGPVRRPAPLSVHAPFRLPEGPMPTGAVFISYASEDLPAAKLVCEGLRRVGCDVWFDVERLSAGDNWRNTLEDEVLKRSVVFVSLISCRTEAHPGYYHSERQWAVERAKTFGAKGTFYVPVIVDPSLSPQALAREPHFARELTIHALPDGRPSPEFCAHVRALQLEATHRRG